MNRALRFLSWALAVALVLVPAVAGAQAITQYPASVQQQLIAKANQFSGGAFSFFFGPSSTNTDPTSTGCKSGQSLGTQPACTGPNIQVNNPNEDAVFVDGVRVRRFRGQSETSIAVSGSNMLATWNDATGFFVPAKGLSGVGFSTNSGQAWCDAGGFFNLLFPARVPFGDTVTAVDNNGNFFSSYLYDAPEIGLAPASALAVSRVTTTTLQTRGCPPNITGETNIGDPPVIAAISPVDFFDKEWLAIDPNPNPATGLQNTYMCYTRFIGTVVGNGQIELIRSLDGGQSWSLSPTVIQPDETLTTGKVNQGCNVTVGPNHEVYVAWENDWISSDTPKIRFARSLDQGVTFSTPVDIAQFNSLAFRPPNGYNRDTINDFPQIAVDRSLSAKRGTIYVTWQAAPAIRSPLADILVAVSSDGGATWQAPRVVNSDPPGTNLHFFPSVSIDSFGNANFMFYDRRLNPFTPSPFNSSTTGGDPNDPGLTDLFGAQLPVIGNKIVNWRITDTTSAWLSARSNIAPNFGDYQQGVSVGSTLFSLWADSRNDNTPSPFFAASDTKAIPSTTK
jgi:hypothetical protein